MRIGRRRGVSKRDGEVVWANEEDVCRGVLNQYFATAKASKTIQDVPIPSTAAISSTFSSPSFVSICTITTTESFAAARYSAGDSPQAVCVYELPKPRRPTGGKRESEAISAAFCGVETWVLGYQVAIACTGGNKGQEHAPLGPRPPAPPHPARA
jgi:hypothetical protein